MKKYGLPILVIIVGSIVYSLATEYLTFNGASTVCTFIRIAIIFGFGVSLCQKRRSNQKDWIKKLVISFFVFFLICWELGYFAFPELRSLMKFLGLTTFGFNLIYVYCGWAFFD